MVQYVVTCPGLCKGHKGLICVQVLPSFILKVEQKTMSVDVVREKEGRAASTPSASDLCGIYLDNRIKSGRKTNLVGSDNVLA